MTISDILDRLDKIKAAALKDPEAAHGMEDDLYTDKSYPDEKDGGNPEAIRIIDERDFGAVDDLLKKVAQLREGAKHMLCYELDDVRLTRGQRSWCWCPGCKWAREALND